MRSIGTAVCVCRDTPDYTARQVGSFMVLHVPVREATLMHSLNEGEMSQEI